MKEIDIKDLRPFEGHPYKVIDNKEMDELVDSIREHGIMTPLIVRRVGDGYEIISGHRRAHAAELAGLTTVSAIEMDLSRDEAAVLLVDSNLHREHILPSEKAFAYKLKLEALSRQGKRTDLTSGQPVPKSDRSSCPDCSWPPFLACRRMPFRWEAGVRGGDCCPPPARRPHRVSCHR
ncbi:MAG: ParB/RepB/Spo0J family partition protein [Ruminococcus sp.]|nr:ParB/RepB/Spo0J family partition protein [Ruminococcus sp.]